MTTPIAAVEMTAQDRGPAVTNIPERFPLLARQNSPPTNQEIALMGAEHIGQL